MAKKTETDAIVDALRQSPQVPNQKLSETAAREETLLVSLVLKDLDLMTDATESGLSGFCFQNETPRKLFALAAEYFDRFHQKMTRAAMVSILASRTTPEDAAFLQSQYDAVYAEYISPKSGEYGMLKENIEGRFVQRQAYAACRLFAEKLLTATSKQKELVSEFQNFVGEISTFGDMNSFIKNAELSDALGRLMVEIDDRREHPENYLGIQSGYKAVDADYNGFQKRKYMVITATEGGGKTTLMLNFGRNFAIRGSNVVYVTFESCNDDIARRILTIHSLVSYNRIMRGGKDPQYGLAPHIMGELKAAKDDLCSGPASRFHLIQVLEHTPLDTIFRRVNRRRAYAPVDVVIVDYLQVIGRERTFGERVDQDIAFVSSKLRAWGRANNVLMVTANQIKTAKSAKLQEAKTDTEELRITKADTSGTKEIAGSADYMFGVFVPLSKDKLILYSTKTRMGRDTQRYAFLYDPESGRVEESSEFGDADKLANDLRDKEKRAAVKEGRPLDAEDENEPPDEKPPAVPMSKVNVEDLQNRPIRNLPIVEAPPAEPPVVEPSPVVEPPPAAEPACDVKGYVDEGFAGET